MTTMGLIRKPKQRKPNKSASPALKKCPQKSAIVKKSFITTPRKPNSAKRKVAKVVFRKTRQVVDIYLEGMSFNKLNPHSVVLVRGRGPRDVPGVGYHAIRGQGDFPALLNRRNARSKYGAKRPKIPQPEKVILSKYDKQVAYRFLSWNNSIFKKNRRLTIRY
jgi:small subunit ribosomal protein S12